MLLLYTNSVRFKCFRVIFVCLLVPKQKKKKQEKRKQIISSSCNLHFKANFYRSWFTSSCFIFITQCYFYCQSYFVFSLSLSRTLSPILHLFIGCAIPRIIYIILLSYAFNCFEHFFISTFFGRL